MSKKKSASRERDLLQKLSNEWELAHPPGHPASDENAWSVDCEYGEMSFANFESAYAYANGLTLGDFRRKVIDKTRRMIEIEQVQADAAGLPC